jgi:hypothetical protein
MEGLEKEFVPYDFALRMKQLGYDGFTLFHINRNNVLNSISESPTSMFQYNMEPNEDDTDSLVAAPTYSQAFRWFRETYGLHHVIHQLNFKKGTDEEYLAEVDKKDGFSYFRTYEECEYYCLEKLIEVVEEKQK